jgi:hypothetical protein
MLTIEIPGPFVNDETFEREKNPGRFCMRNAEAARIFSLRPQAGV